MSQPIAVAGRATAAVIALCVGLLLFMLSALGLTSRLLGTFSDYWSGTAGISTPKIPFIDSWAEITKENGDSFSGFIFSSGEPLVQSRLLTASAAILDSLVIMVGCVVIVLVATRMLSRRSFSRVARWGLVALGLLIILDATVGPQLAPLASDIALQELDYYVIGPDNPGMMTEHSPDRAYLNLWDPIWVANRFDITLLMLGIVVLLFGSLVRDGVSLQKETEGLV